MICTLFTGQTVRRVHIKNPLLFYILVVRSFLSLFNKHCKRYRTMVGFFKSCGHAADSQFDYPSFYFKDTVLKSNISVMVR